jgi:high-affinity Fe2+/Pb2+ permease
MAHDFRFALNNNGDTPDTLKREFEEVRRAAVKLQEAIGLVTVHGRNYQTLDDAQTAHQHDLDAKVAAYGKAEEIKDWAMAGYAAVVRQREGL